jgi:hypothetical protein
MTMSYYKGAISALGRARILIAGRGSNQTAGMDTGGLNDHLLRDMGLRRDLSGFHRKHLVRF